jgi:hypothetical protein
MRAVAGDWQAMVLLCLWLLLLAHVVSSCSMRKQHCHMPHPDLQCFLPVGITYWLLLLLLLQACV